MLLIISKSLLGLVKDLLQVYVSLLSSGFRILSSEDVFLHCPPPSITEAVDSAEKSACVLALQVPGAESENFVVKDEDSRGLPEQLFLKINKGDWWTQVHRIYTAACGLLPVGKCISHLCFVIPLHKSRLLWCYYIILFRLSGCPHSRQPPSLYSIVLPEAGTTTLLIISLTLLYALLNTQW